MDENKQESSPVQTVSPSGGARMAELSRDAMREFAKAATVRAVRTMAQTAASLLGAKALISDVDWKALISATVMAGILSILTSVYTGLPETGTPLPEIAERSDEE